MEDGQQERRRRGLVVRPWALEGPNIGFVDVPRSASKRGPWEQHDAFKLSLSCAAHVNVS